MRFEDIRKELIYETYEKNKNKVLLISFLIIV